MSDHKVRHPDLIQVSPLREYIRREFPNGGDGFVAEDLDLVIRHFGPNYQSDGKGRFMLVEQKHPHNGIGKAQSMTFGLMDELCRRGDTEDRYMGYYLLNVAFDGMEPIFPVTINGQRMDREQFGRWIQGELIVPGLFRGFESNPPQK